MSQYTALAQRAQATIARKGGTVTFSRGGAAAYDAATDTWTGATIAPVTAPALQVRSDPQLLIALELVLLQPITLLVAGAPLGSFVPQPADVMLWAGLTYTIKSVADTAPDGSTAILYRCIGSR